MTMIDRFRRFYAAGQHLFCWEGLALRALLLSMVFLILRLAGCHELTSILCGMEPITGGAAKIGAFFGFVYVLFHVAFTVLVPMLLIAAGLLRFWQAEAEAGSQRPEVRGQPSEHMG
jgi:hypothetical protein